MNGGAKGNAHRESHITWQCSHLSALVYLVNAEKFAAGKKTMSKRMKNKKNPYSDSDYLLFWVTAGA